jgi:hypothetical protein
MTKNSFSKAPPSNKKDLSKDDEIKAFITGAESDLIESFESLQSMKTSSNEPIEEKFLPWKNSNVRSDVFKVFNLRLPEEYFIKLDYLAKSTKESKQKICLDAVISDIDKRLKNT